MMRHVVVLKFVLVALLCASTFAAAQTQRVFVNTSLPPVSLNQPFNQPFVIASQAVGDAMKQVLTFDVLADVVVNICASDSTPSYCGGLAIGNFDIWICDSSDCKGSLRTNLADVATVQLFRLSPSLHVKATFARKYPSESRAAVLIGDIVLTETTPIGWIIWENGINGFGADGYYVAVTGPTSPVDLYSGNRYIVTTLTLTSFNSGQFQSSDTVQTSLLRVNTVP
jgi:hypothetical protein